MRYVEALEEYEPKPGDHGALFVAGGIKGCEDWQSRYCKLFEGTPLIVMNPRRVRFNWKDEDSAEQVNWEFRHLSRASAISFWLSPETLNPITLFELGTWSNSRVPIYVGCHPEYQKRRTVTQQLLLRRPEVCVVDSIEKLALTVRAAMLNERNSMA